MLPRPNVCYIYQKQGVQEFECDIGCLLVTKTQFYALVELNIFQGWIFFRGEYFSGVNIFQWWIFFRDEYFPGENIFQRWIFIRGEYFSGLNICQWKIFVRGNGRIFFQGVNIFQGWIFFRWIFLRGEYFRGKYLFRWWIFFRGKYDHSNIMSDTILWHCIVDRDMVDMDMED